MTRRDFICNATLITSGAVLGVHARAAEESVFPVVRTPAARRKFKSAAVERTIDRVKAGIGNKELAWMFGNCFSEHAGYDGCV